MLLQFPPPSLSGIVAALDVVKDICSGLGSRPVVPPVFPFPLEDPEEALGGRIVGATAYCTHTARHLMHRREPLILL